MFPGSFSYPVGPIVGLRLINLFHVILICIACHCIVFFPRMVTVNIEDEYHHDFSPERNKPAEHLELVCSATCQLRSLNILIVEWNLRLLVRLKVGKGVLDSLRGLGTCHSLQELICPFNRLVSLDELWGHPSLETLDVEGNLLSDEGNWMVVHSIPNLRQLEIAGNPIAENYLGENPDSLRSTFPSLESFNGIELQPCAQSRITTASSSLSSANDAPKQRRHAAVKAFPIIPKMKK